MESQGLSSQAAHERLVLDGPNLLPAEQRRNLFQQIFSVLREPMLLLLVAAAGISLVLAEPVEAIALSVGVLLIISISIIQTRRTDAALDALKELNAPMAVVVRDGVELRISSHEVVVGDLLVFGQGERIPADARLLEAVNLSVDESSLTGESLPVNKGNNDDVFSGTLVVAGHGMALATATASATKIGTIGTLLAEQAESRTPLQREVDQIVRFVSTIALVTAVAVAILYSITRGDWLTGALAGIASAMALLPEELPVVLTIFLGLGALRLSRKKVIVRSSPAIETLGSVTVVCADKTGTITENRMVLISPSPAVSNIGRLASAERAVDPMDAAFHEVAVVPEGFVLVREYHINSNWLAFCQVWDSGSGDYVVALKGAPEDVFRLCGMTAEETSEALRQVADLANDGLRVLGVAQAQTSRQHALPSELSEFNFAFVGLAALRDPVREGVSVAVRNLLAAKVRVVMITGDFPGTAAAVASEVGLQNPGDYLTGEQVSELSDAQLLDRIKTVSVFARMMPEQKLRLVELLRASGEIVAMTGDGVNDAPALKRAHVGIAMGKRGSEVAREASDLLITDDSFTTIASGIAEGRRIYSNLRRAAAYVIAIHVPIFGLAVLPVTGSMWPLILLPAQIALLELVIDPAASVAYQAEPAAADQMQRKPKPLTEKLLSKTTLLHAFAQGLALFVAATVVFLFAGGLALEEGQVRMLTFTTLLSGNLILMLSNRSDTQSLFKVLATRKNNAALTILIIGYGALLLVNFVPAFHQALRMENVGAQYLLLAYGASLAPLIVHEAIKAFVRRGAGRKEAAQSI